MKEDTEASPFALLASDGAFDPLEDGVRQRVRHFIETVLEEELQAALGRGRYERLVLLTYILAGAFVTTAVAVLPLGMSAMVDRVAKMPGQTVSRRLLVPSRRFSPPASGPLRGGGESN